MDEKKELIQQVTNILSQYACQKNEELDYKSQSLKTALNLRKQVITYQENIYLNFLQQANTKYADIIKDDLGSQFVNSCGRDLAGELVRTYFPLDTSDFNITVDQIAERILKFDYEQEYDPWAQNDDLQKLVYNYNDNNQNSTFNEIISDLDSAQEKLFVKENKKYVDSTIIERGKSNYVKNKLGNSDILTDEYTGNEGEFVLDKNGNKKRRLQVDHSQAAATAKYNKNYITQQGIEELKKFYNSDDNFAMMLDTANQSKGDVKVLDKDRNDITHRATPEQYASAVTERWENTNGETKQKLIDQGYLNPDGSVSKFVKNKLKQNVRNSQNIESNVILKDVVTNGGYKEVAKDAGKHAEKSMGKIIAGQVIYYMMPPLLYEIRGILRNKKVTIEEAIDNLQKSGERICNYVIPKISDIFKNVVFNSLKKFIKSFFDILINMVKATVKKMLKLAKNLVMSTVDAVKIISNKQSTSSQKADAVCNLFAVTITSFAVEVLFEYIEHAIPIPEPLLAPLQVMTTIVCTNLTMLVLQKADLFNVRFGFKIQKIREEFSKAETDYNLAIQSADDYNTIVIREIIEEAKSECVDVYNNLTTLNHYEHSVSESLERVNNMFEMKISFKNEWLKFIGMYFDDTALQEELQIML